jgi:hypothetical protein
VAAGGRNRFQSVAARISIRSMNKDREEQARGDAGSGPADGVEIWARRVGRTLGWTVAVLLVIYLLRTYAT